MDLPLAPLAPLLVAPPRGPLVSLLIKAPPAPLERFLQLPLPGDPLLWDARCWGEERAVAGRGVARRWEATGPDRFASLRRLAAPELAAIEVRAAHPTDSDAPRCYGGASFDLQRRDPAWGSFADASFVLPRLCYEHTTTGARLRVTVPAEELLDPAAIEGEVASILAALLVRGPDEDPPEARLRDGAERSYKAAVAGALDAISAGVFEKIVVARAIDLELLRPASPWRSLAAFEGPLVRFAFGRAGATFLGATPERLVSLGAGEVRTEAVAGSIAPGEHDAVLRLLRSDKDRREHQVVVDAITAALGPLCVGVEASAAPAVRALRHVLHMVTTVTATAPAGRHVLELVDALHPTPAVCGLPRQPAARWLREREGFDRGWYAAPVGWFDASGDGGFAAALRSALVEGERARVFAGAGIVRGSTPEAELRETSIKAQAMIEALGGGAP